MAVQKKEIQYAKEIDDVAVLLVSVLRDVKAGKTAAEIANGAITKLIEALAGVDQMDDEVKGNRVVALQTIGYRMGDLADAILPKV